MRGALRYTLIEIFLRLPAFGVDRMVLPADRGQIEISGLSGPRAAVLREKQLAPRETHQ